MNQYPNPAPRPVAVRLPTYRPRVTYVMMAILTAIFAIQMLTGGNDSPLLEWGANIGPAVTQGQYWRLLTANFLHANLMHFAFNMYALYVIGTEVETFYGPWRFLIIFLSACLAGAICSYAFTYKVSVGASTGIFGLFGTLVAFFVRNRAVFGEMGRTRLTNLIVVIAINLFYGLSVSFIDMWGHVGGFIGGVILGWLLCPFYQIEARTNGFHHVVDRNSLRSEWLGVGLVIILMAVAFWAARQSHIAEPFKGFYP
jgi:rhomboid protease GluP